MMTSSTFSISSFRHTRTSAIADHKPAPELETEPHIRKTKGSSKLNRWSLARSIRSGRKLDRPVNSNQTADVNSPVKSHGGVSPRFLPEVVNEGEDDVEMAVGKSIYMVSDGTGWTAEHSVNAALGQFEYCLVDRGCSVDTHLFSGCSRTLPRKQKISSGTRRFRNSLWIIWLERRNRIFKDKKSWEEIWDFSEAHFGSLDHLTLIDDVDRLMEIVKQAAKEGAMLIYTLADSSMAESAKKACKLWGVPSTDILGPITEAIACHLGVSPSGLPRGAPGRKFPLNEDYFRRIEAIEFTIKQDDGSLPENLHKADIILTGVSRTGKTPLSIYLSQKGYKVANVPIVLGIGLPKTIFEVDPQKIIGLTINPVVLQTIRRARAKSLGLADDGRSNYSEMDHVRKELEFAGKIFAQNPVWPVIEVTGKAIEETAAVVLRLYHDRKQKCSMARISKRY